MTAQAVLNEPIVAMSQTFLDRINQLRSLYLDEILAEISAVVSESTPGSTLSEMTDYHLSTGGKRLRALIPLAVADAMGADPKAMIPFGAACEILHNATLVHDDLQDGDKLRRGQDAVWVKYGAPQAINLGDAMLYYTLLLVNRLDVDAEQRMRASQRVLNETLRVIDGQEREFGLQSMSAPTVEDYFRMVEGKTSGLFALPMAGAAELSGADDALVNALTRAAQHLGVIFQIQDDVLDLFGDKGRERRGSDIAEGKITAMVVHCLNNASEEDATWFRSILSKPRPEVTDAEITRAIALIEDTGSLQFALDEIDRRRAAVVNDDQLMAHPPLLALTSAMVDLFLKPIQSVF